jgi:hypothetical protein
MVCLTLAMTRRPGDLFVDEALDEALVSRYIPAIFHNGFGPLAGDYHELVSGFCVGNVTALRGESGQLQDCWLYRRS